METNSIRCLSNSISRFILLLSCQTWKAMPTQKDLESMATLLKHLKPLLDDLDDENIASDSNLWNACESLDISVNAARDFIEQWSPKMSKILSVLQSEQVLTKIRSSSLEMCGILCRLLRNSPPSSGLDGVQVCTKIMHCVQELQSWQTERLSKHIEQALRNKDENLISCSENLAEIVNSLSLVSNQELLTESIAVEKERMKVRANEANDELGQINQIVDLLPLIRQYMLENGCSGSVSDVSIPLYFRCPLSLDFMLDPVIVASGQTFEKSAIQKWLDNGLNICPKTRQHLSHTNVIPNYTVKALVANWLEDNNLKFPGVSEITKVHSEVSMSNDFSSQDVIHTDSFGCSIHSSDSMSISEVSSNTCQSVEAEKSNQHSPEHSYTHSRTQSAASALSSSDYVPSKETEILRIPDRDEKVSEIVSEHSSESTTISGRESQSARTSADSRMSDRHEKASEIVSERSTISGIGSQSAKASAGMTDGRSNNYARAFSLPSSDSEYDETTTSARVEKLVDNLKSPSNSSQTAACAELRLLGKLNMENRILIGKCGAIDPLISLLHSENKVTQEHAVTALLNLSLNEENKAMIGLSGIIEPLIHVLKTGTDAAKENSAATLFSLSVLEEYKLKIGRSGAVKGLVNLLAHGTLRGKKDAATALFNLSICHDNKARIVQAGAVKSLVQLLDPTKGMVDKSVALLANLSTVSEGRLAIAREKGIPWIVEIVDTGSQRGKENAAAVLLQLCLNSTKYCNMVLQEGAVPPLVALSQSGTPRGKEKAQQLLSHFRNQREGASKKSRDIRS